MGGDPGWLECELDNVGEDPGWRECELAEVRGDPSWRWRQRTLISDSQRWSELR